MFHTVGAVPFHLVGDVTINVKGKGCGSVAQVALDRLDVISRPDGCNRIAVPLWHNKDKSENP